MTSPTEPDRTDGFIIVAVLWILGALAALVSIYAVYVVTTALAFTGHESRLQTEQLVASALELAAYQLTGSAQAPPTHGSFSFRLAKANIVVSFQSEAARIDLNAAPKELVAGLFTVLGVNADSAADYAERIVRWRTLPSKDQGPAAPNPATAPANTSSGTRFFHVGELAAVPGLPRDLVDRALPFVTVYSGRAQVNIFDAAPQILAALPGITGDQLNTVLTQRQAANDGRGLLQLLGPAQIYATTEGSGASRISIHVAYDGGARSKSEVIILPFDQGDEPYGVLSWNDALEE